MRKQFTTIANEFSVVFKQKTWFEKTLILVWVLMPFIMMLSRSITDLLIVLSAVLFLLKSSINSSWMWLKISWVKWALCFSVISILSSAFSSLAYESMTNGLSWLRFPLFALAFSFWIVKDREILLIALISNFISLILIFIFMIYEVTLTNNTIFSIPFGNPLNGPFIHRIGLIFITFSLVGLFLHNKNWFLYSFFISISLFFSILSGHRVGTFSYFIIIFILAFWPSINLRKTFFIFSGLFFLALCFFLYNPTQLDRYFIQVINLSNTSLLQYFGLWTTGLNVFILNPFIGVGPTNVQNYLELGLIQNFDPYSNNEHPHNHYIQAFAETGFLGGVFYCLMILNIIKSLYLKVNKNYNSKDYILLSSVFICSVCLFWPFSNTYDLFGQQQNGFLWYCLSLYMVTESTIKDKV